MCVTKQVNSVCFTINTSACEMMFALLTEKRGQEGARKETSSLCLFTRNPYPVRKPHVLTRDGPSHRGMHIHVHV